MPCGITPLAVHPKTIHPAILGVLLKHFAVTERAPPAGGNESASDGCRAPDPPAVVSVIGVEAEEGSTK